MKKLSPNQAAKIAGVSRGTIMTAVKSQKIKASRTNVGWQIDSDSLDDWSASRGVSSGMLVSMSDDDSLTVQLKTDNAVLKERLQSKDQLIERLEDEVAYLRQPFWQRWFKAR